MARAKKSKIAEAVGAVSGLPDVLAALVDEFTWDWDTPKWLKENCFIEMHTYFRKVAYYSSARPFGPGASRRSMWGLARVASRNAAALDISDMKRHPVCREIWKAMNRGPDVYDAQLFARYMSQVRNEEYRRLYNAPIYRRGPEGQDWATIEAERRAEADKKTQQWAPGGLMTLARRW